MRQGLKKTLKVTLITLASAVGLCVVAVAVVLWLVLTPSRLTPIVEEAANRYLNAEVRIGKVDVTLLSTFPRLTLRVEDGEMVVRNTGDSTRSAKPHRDSLLRFVHGVLKEGSLTEESFSNGLLEYPQYTRPQSFEGLDVPAVLVSGNHAEIAKWRKQESIKKTKKNRPDLLEGGKSEN